MATPESQRLFDTPHFGLQSTPPATPGPPSEQPRFHPSAASHTSPVHTRYNPMFAHSPPYEHLKPTGQQHQFSYTRPQVEDALSRASSVSGEVRASSPDPSNNASEQSINPNPKFAQRYRVVEGHFEVEEMEDTGVLLDADTEVVRPDMTEEASSVKSAESFVEGLQQLNCGPGSDAGREEQQRRYRKKKKRWSRGQYTSSKRSHSQSVGSDTEDDDAEGLDAHDVGSSARRLRRRIRGPGDRTSLNFEDVREYRLHEVDEPTDEGIFSNRPPSIASDGEIVPLEQLPFWSLDPMVIDSDSSRPSTRAGRSSSHF